MKERATLIAAEKEKRISAMQKFLSGIVKQSLDIEFRNVSPSWPTSTSHSGQVEARIADRERKERPDQMKLLDERAVGLTVMSSCLS